MWCLEPGRSADHCPRLRGALSCRAPTAASPVRFELVLRQFRREVSSAACRRISEEGDSLAREAWQSPVHLSPSGPPASWTPVACLKRANRSRFWFADSKARTTLIQVSTRTVRVRPASARNARTAHVPRYEGTINRCMVTASWPCSGRAARNERHPCGPPTPLGDAEACGCCDADSPSEWLATRVRCWVRAIHIDLSVITAAIGPTSHLAASCSRWRLPGDLLHGHVMRRQKGFVDARPLWGKVSVKGNSPPDDLFRSSAHLGAHSLGVTVRTMTDALRRRTRGPAGLQPPSTWPAPARPGDCG